MIATESTLLDRLPSHRLEALFWMSGLLAVALADPWTAGFASVCPFDAIGNWAGLEFCPGCGLGHAVGFMVRGAWAESVAAHPLGMPAAAMLTLHSARLWRARPSP